jgi:hypothetical protein
MYYGIAGRANGSKRNLRLVREGSPEFLCYM